MREIITAWLSFISSGFHLEIQQSPSMRLYSSRYWCQVWCHEKPADRNTALRPHWTCIFDYGRRSPPLNIGYLLCSVTPSQFLCVSSGISGLSTVSINHLFTNHKRGFKSSGAFKCRLRNLKASSKGCCSWFWISCHYLVLCSNSGFPVLTTVIVVPLVFIHVFIFT